MFDIGRRLEYTIGIEPLSKERLFNEYERTMY